MDLLYLLQISDSAFPTGSFAHSCGYEAALQRSFLSSDEDTMQFLYAVLENTASQLLPFVREAHCHWPEQGEVIRLDHLLAATLSNHVARRASRQQGRSLVQTACATYDSSSLLQLRVLVDQGKIEGHQPVVYGALCSELGISEEGSVISFLFAALRNTLASAVRLGKVGTLQAQRLQSEIQKTIPEIVTRSKARTTGETCSTFPVVDLLHSSHDLLFMRMFYS